MSGNMFVRFNNPRITGSSKIKGHEGDVEVLSWSFGASQPTSPVRSQSGGGTIERTQCAPLCFTKYIDRASDDLLKGVWTGRPIGKVDLMCYRASGDGGANQMGVLYLTITLERVIVGNYEIRGEVGDLPTEHIELKYAKATFAYSGDGGVETISYDQATDVIA
ncbi:MAG: type VI secretion system tube protein Hcp [Myxococcales bacterium]|nr:type VI secretion system tube protein Hcp [Myxococcales bacterium]